MSILRKFYTFRCVRQCPTNDKEAPGWYNYGQPFHLSVIAFDKADARAKLLKQAAPPPEPGARVIVLETVSEEPILLDSKEFFVRVIKTKEGRVMLRASVDGGKTFDLPFFALFSQMAYAYDDLAGIPKLEEVAT